MDRRFRRGFTAAEKTELWDRWQRGESLKAIGRAFGKPSSSIYNQVAPHGGIRPLPRRRSRLALTLLEREEISRGVAAHQSARSMARLLGRSPSTVSRELKRNGGYDGYRAAPADEQAWVRTHRPKRGKLAINPWLRQAVASKLRLNWAPEQIAGWLKRSHRRHEAQAKLSAMHVLKLSISSFFNMESGDGERYREVVQSHQGLWFYSTGRWRQGRVRSYLGGRDAPVSAPSTRVSRSTMRSSLIEARNPPATSRSSDLGWR